MNLDQIRVFVRTQLDLDDTDLPDVLLDVFVRDGYQHVIAMERRWPFFESEWDLQVPTDTGRVPAPPDSDVIESLLSSNGHRLWRVDTRWMEDNFTGSTSAGTPTYWSQLNRTIRVSPRPSADTTMYARGFRAPSDWVSQGASAEVDADIRLHLPVAWYCCALGYAQQEDEVLEATYMNRYHEAVKVAHDSVMRPWTGAPKILNGTHYGNRPRGGAPSLVFQLPSGEVVP